MNAQRMIILLILACVSKFGWTQPVADDLGGHMQARIDGQLIEFPILKTDIQADLQGDLATVTVTQHFANPLDRAVNASYLFALNQYSAVYAMEMAVGDERIKAQIMRIEEAKATFTKAKKEGKSAALLTQHRPNMFTQEIANLMPEQDIVVTLHYVQTIPKRDGNYELIIPLVVGPRFQPTGAGVAPTVVDPHDPHGTTQQRSVNSRDPHGRWEIESLPAYPPVAGLTQPATVSDERVSITINLEAGMQVNDITSPSHGIHSEQLNDSHYRITLDDGRVRDDRDFILRYRLAGETAQAGLLATQDERGGFFSLLIEPPAVPNLSDITPREMVFVLDCSGSMHGRPMEASKAFMRAALHALRPSDSFRIIRFSEHATEFSRLPLPATIENIRQGISYIEGLSGMGGTMMSSGIKQAFAPRVTDGTIRLVTFLTDGYIGNEAEIIGLINRKIGDARLFSFGVGNAVNRYLLDEMALAGRGFTRIMAPGEQAEEVAKSLAERLQTPVLTDLRIDWGELDVSAVNPASIPDLFAGESIRLSGRYTTPGTYEIKLHGLINGRPAAMPLKVNLPTLRSDGKAIALVWARESIRQAMHRFHAPANRHDAIKQQITDLGLKFSLATKWTSFVAVSEKIYNHTPSQSVDMAVPISRVKGVGPSAYPTSSNNLFTGSATPEPEEIIGLALLACIWMFSVWFNRARSLSVARI